MPSPFALRNIASIVLISAALVACMNGEPDARPPDRPPALVRVEVVEPETIELSRDFSGRVRGVLDVDVRAQVPGILLARRYEEGAEVSQGHSLFLLDPEPFEVALQAAEANKADADAALAQAQREWRRNEQMYAGDAVSQREYDRARADLELAQAGQKRAAAAVAEARLNLRHTEVYAPIGGVTDIEAVSEGALIERGTLLTRITQLDPVQVVFALPENAARQLRGSANRNIELRWRGSTPLLRTLQRSP
jgi:membrane fusion protein (multidrug efflux system)